MPRPIADSFEKQHDLSDFLIWDVSFFLNTVFRACWTGNQPEFNELQAKTIAESLESSGQKHAAKTLRDRMAACSACDMLVTKDTRRMEPQKMQQTLLNCEEAWVIFPVHVKTKVFENNLVTVRLPQWLKGAVSKKQAEQVESAAEFANALAISPHEQGKDMGLERFDVKSPTMDMVFHSFVEETQETMQALGLFDDPEKRMPDSDCLGIDEVERAHKEGNQDHHPQMMELQKKAEDCFSCNCFSLTVDTTKNVAKLFPHDLMFPQWTFERYYQNQVSASAVFSL